MRRFLLGTGLTPAQPLGALREWGVRGWLHSDLEKWCLMSENITLRSHPEPLLPATFVSASFPGLLPPQAS